jgi:hypothetical protein
MTKNHYLIILILGIIISGVLVLPVDGDGIPGYVEVLSGDDPVISDHDDDGYIEVQFGGNPLVADTDGDGISDDVELNSETKIYDPDTDNDGLGDAEEEARGTDPLNPDTDGDGLSDGREVEINAEIEQLRFNANVQELSPTDPDSDGDALGDGFELRLARELFEKDNLSARDPKLAPVDSNFDAGRYMDGVELIGGENPYARQYSYQPDSQESDVEPYSTAPGSGPRTHSLEVPDPDGDGYSTMLETFLPNADPQRQDIYVELDYMDECGPPSRETIRLVEQAFADAPTENPDGSTGISLHIVVDDSVPTQQIRAPEGGESKWGTHPELGRLSSESYFSQYYQNRTYGYQYGIAATSVSAINDESGNVLGTADSGYFVYECSGSSEEQAHILMHEIGHSLGLIGGNKSTDISYYTHPAVDSYEYSVQAYPSTMNYNAPQTYLGFTESEWEFLSSERYYMWGVWPEVADFNGAVYHNRSQLPDSVETYIQRPENTTGSYWAPAG